MARTRQIYQTDLLYVGPTGENPATGSHFPSITQYDPTGDLSEGSKLPEPAVANAENLVAQLFRTQRVSWNAQKNLTDVNQFGELVAIDRIGLEPPTVQLTFDYLLANLANEKRMGLDVSEENDVTEVSMISGVLAGLTNPKNYFLKTVSEGADAADNNSTTYNTIALGNGFISSYSVQGSVGSFPTVSVTVDALNVNGDAFDAAISGNYIPAVNVADGAEVKGWWYNLPAGTTSVDDAALSTNAGISALRPGDITLDLGVTEVGGESFFSPSDMKVQSFNLSFDLAQEDLNKLGSKYAFAKVPTFPVNTSMQVEAIAGDFITGTLTQIVDSNTDYNPSVTLYTVGGTADDEIIAKFTMKGAKLDTQASDLSIGQNKTISLTFNAQIGGPQSLDKGFFASGVARV